MIALLLFSIGVMDRANSRFRIGLMFSLMAYVIVASTVTVIRSRRKRDKHIEDTGLSQERGERIAEAQAK